MVNIYLYCEFICNFPFSKMYFPTRVQYRRRIDVLNKKMNTITHDFGYSFNHANYPKSSQFSLFKKQRYRFRFSPIKLCTVMVNIYLYCEFICNFPFSKMYFPTRVQYRRRIDVLNKKMNTITHDFGYSFNHANYPKSSQFSPYT